MAASVRALRAFRLAGRVVAVGEVVVCDAAVAADVLASGKAAPADERTRERWTKAQPATVWTEAPAEEQAVPRQFAVNWRSLAP